MARPDPFYDVKRKAENWWSSISAHYEEWQQLQVTQGNQQEVSKLTKAIKEGIRAINVDLKDLQQTIEIVESARAKFPAINDTELESRKAFVSDMKVQVKQVKDAITSAKSARQSEEAVRTALVSKPSSSGRARKGGVVDETPTGLEESNPRGDAIVAAHQQQQQEIEAEQDEVLVDIEEALGNLTNMADGINAQLRDHAVLINELDDNLDTANSTMKMVNTKLTKLLGTSDKGRLCCILILFITAILLFVGIIYG